MSLMVCRRNLQLRINDGKAKYGYLSTRGPDSVNVDINFYEITQMLGGPLSQTEEPVFLLGVRL